MACNCKNTITSFLGGDVANPTTFLNCGEADGTYNNPLETGKTQCIAENNVLRILDDYKISGTVKNAGEIIFERTFTGDTDSWEEWNNDGTYFRPINQTDTRLSAQTLNTSGAIAAGGSITTGTHDGSNILYVNRFNSTYAYGHIYGGRSDENTAVGLRFVTRSTGGVAQEAFTLLGDDRKATFQGNLVVSGTNTTLDTLSAKTAINVGNGNGTISANTFTAPSISIGKESGVVTATTVAAKYSGSVITNSTDRTITMEVETFRPGMVVSVDMGAGSGDITITLPALADWGYGKYTFIFPKVPNGGSNFVLNSANSTALFGISYCLNGPEIINAKTTVTFSAGKTIAGTRIEVLSDGDGTIMTHIMTPTNQSNVAYS